MYVLLWPLTSIVKQKQEAFDLYSETKTEMVRQNEKCILKIK